MASCSPSKERRAFALAVKRLRPAAVRLNGLVYGVHQPDRLVQGDDDFLVVLDVGVVEGAALSVFEPLFADLVAADAEVPDVCRNAAEILGGVDVDAAGGVGGRGR